MKSTWKSLFGALSIGALLINPAVAQTFVPQVQAIGPNDQFQDVVNGAAQAGNVYASGLLISGYSNTLAGGNYDNALIGGDFSTNLFQRGTSVSTAGSTYYVAYGADRWFTWGGTSTPTTMTQQTGAADTPAAASASYRINKGSLTGTAQICTSQIVESANAYRFQGQTAEFTFDALAGSTFSAASSNLAVYISYGTVADEGATKMAYGLNTLGGSGTTAWTGQVNLGGTNGYLIPISTGWTRYGVAASIPTTAKEIGVSICYTPVGTGTATDWFEFAKAQLTINPTQTSFANASGAVLSTSALANAKAFARRPQALETVLQQRYFYQLKETAAITPVAPCSAVDTTHTNCIIQFPVSMRTTPTMTYTAGFASPTSTTQATLGACSALATSAVVTSTAANPLNVLVYCTATTIPAAGVASFLYSNNGSGLITASAEE